MKNAALGFLLVASLSVAAHATTITPGGPLVDASNAIVVTSVDTLGQVYNASTTGSGIAATYTELAELDSNNPYNAVNLTNSLTFLITLTNVGTNQIFNVSLDDGFGSASSLNVGFIAGGGEGGVVTPQQVSEDANGVVNFWFQGTGAIAPGAGTEYLVIQTPFTQLPGGTANSGLGTVRIGAPLATATTPEPGTLALFGTGLLGCVGVLRRRRSQQPV